MPPGPAAVQRASAGAAAGLLLSFLAACGPSPPAPPPGPPVWEGQAEGTYFRPAFQRWRIVEAQPLPGAAVPPEAGSVPVALLERDVFMGPGYFTFPRSGGAGDLVVPACFSATPTVLRAGMPGAATPEPATLAEPEALAFRRQDDGRVAMDLNGLFHLVLERRPVEDDEGYRERLFAAAYNHRLARESERIAGAPCSLAPAPVALRAARSLTLRSVESGREVVLKGADLDPVTPIEPRSASAPQRRSLPLGDPDGIVGGCAGVVRVLRAVEQASPRAAGRSEFLIVGGVAGKTADGERCDRVDLLRRIDPARLLALYGVPDSRAPVTMRLLGWVGPASFTAQVGDAEFELAGVDQRRIQVSLVRAPGAATEADVAVEPDLGEPPPLAPVPAAGPPPRKASQKIERWVDEDGVVHYSNTGRPRRQGTSAGNRPAGPGSGR